MTVPSRRWRLDLPPPICNPPPQAEAAWEATVNFRILGRISHAETIAQGAGIRELSRLRRIYGPGNWRKRKGPPAYDWTTAMSAWPNRTDTRPTASDAAR